MGKINELALSQIERRLKPIRAVAKNTKVRQGWIHYIRHALGMTLKNLGDRASVSIGTIAQAERGEVSGKITISTLKKMAEAMECEFVYAFVPKKSVKDILNKNALDKATRILLVADTHMELEDQQVTQDIKIRIKSLANKLIEKGDVW